MRNFISLSLSIFSPLAAVPTGWAIYAGVTGVPAFPMNPYAAGIGAVAVIATSIAAGLLIVDIMAYNQGMKNKTEREELGMSTTWAWFIFGGCVLAEITLSLLIVVIPGALVFGVLVFPLLTAAGVFAFAVRYDLQKREAERTQIRLSKPKPAKSERKPKEKPAEPTPEPAKPVFVCSVAGCKAKPFGSQAALNAHQRKHKQIAGYAVSFEPIKQDEISQGKL